MHKTKHIVTAGLMSLALAGAGHRHADAAVSVNLNGQPLATRVAPVSLRNHTLVPMRDIFEALGASVQWNELTQGITAQKDNSRISLQIGNGLAIVNGQRVQLEQPAVLYGGATMVPLRFVSEALGANVDWNGGLQLVSITLPMAPRTGTVIALNPAPLPVAPVAPAPALNNDTGNDNAPAYNGNAPAYNGNAPAYNGNDAGYNPPVNTPMPDDRNSDNYPTNDDRNNDDRNNDDRNNDAANGDARNNDYRGDSDRNTYRNDRNNDDTQPAVGEQVADSRTIRVPEGVVVPVTLDQKLSSETSHVGDTFTAAIESQRLGDSEFPAGSKLQGRVIEAMKHDGSQPGVLGLEFTSVIFPNGDTQPLNGQLTSLDKKDISQTPGRIIARGSSRSKGSTLKIIGIGAGIGYVAGTVFHHNRAASAAIGAAGGFIYDRLRGKRSSEADVKAGTRLGVRLDDPVAYADNTGYARYRLAYLRM